MDGHALSGHSPEAFFSIEVSSLSYRAPGVGRAGSWCVDPRSSSTLHALHALHALRASMSGVLGGARRGTAGEQVCSGRLCYAQGTPLWTHGWLIGWLAGWDGFSALLHFSIPRAPYFFLSAGLLGCLFCVCIVPSPFVDTRAISPLALTLTLTHLHPHPRPHSRYRDQTSDCVY